MFKRLLSLSFIVVSVFLVGCKNQITDTPKQEDYTPINLSGQYEVSFVLNSENYINQVNIKTKNYDSWSVTGIELDSMEFFTGLIIGSMYYFPGSGYILFTMEDGGILRPFRTFTSYQYYPNTKQLIALKPEDNCAPFNYSFWSGSDTVVYGIQQGVDSNDELYSKEVRCDININQYITESIANQSIGNGEVNDQDKITQGDTNIERIKEYYSYLSNKQRDNFSTYHRLKDLKQQTSDQIKSTYSNTERVDIVDIKPIEGQDNTYTITIDLITKYAISRYINTKQVINSGDTRYIQNKDSVDSFHIPRLPGNNKESEELYPFHSQREDTNKLWKGVRDLIARDNRQELKNWFSNRNSTDVMNTYDGEYIDVYVVKPKNSILILSRPNAGGPDCDGVYIFTYLTIQETGLLNKVWMQSPNQFFDYMDKSQSYKKLCGIEVCADTEKTECYPTEGEGINGKYFKTLTTRFGKATEDMRKKSLGIE